MNQARTDYLTKLKDYGLENNIPNVTETGGRFLHFLVGLQKPKRILEIGMANGYSTIWMADSAEQYGGELVCYDVSANTVAEAIENFKACELTNIEIRNTNPLREPIPDEEFYDFIFVDGQKGRYHELWDVAKKHLAPNGFIIFDDVINFDHKTEPFRLAMEQDQDYEKVLLPIDAKDGIMMVQKK